MSMITKEHVCDEIISYKFKLKCHTACLNIIFSLGYNLLNSFQKKCNLNVTQHAVHIYSSGYKLHNYDPPPVGTAKKTNSVKKKFN